MIPFGAEKCSFYPYGMIQLVRIVFPVAAIE